MKIVRYTDGKRETIAAEPAGAHRRFAAVDAGQSRIAVADRVTGELVAYVSERRAFSLARFLNVLDPSADQLAAILGGGQRGAPLLHTTTLKYAGSVCHRCGQELKVGQHVRWNSDLSLGRHLRACPRLPRPKLPRRRPA